MSRVVHRGEAQTWGGEIDDSNRRVFGDGDFAKGAVDGVATFEDVEHLRK